MPDLAVEDLAFPVCLLITQDKADFLISLVPQMQQGYSSDSPLVLGLTYSASSPSPHWYGSFMTVRALVVYITVKLLLKTLH